MASEFGTTRWTIVVAARDQNRPDAQAALAELCEAYWYPLYAYVRRRVGSVHEAQDFTQAFFVWVLEQRLIQAADPERGRFRAFLLTACQRFLINQWHKARAEKRGGGRRQLSLDFESGESKLSMTAIDSMTPEQLYQQQWAITLLERVMEQLRAEYVAKERAKYFDVLKPFLYGLRRDVGYSEAARRVGISETTAKVAAHRMRRRYRALLRAEIAQTVGRPEEVEDEICELFAALGQAT